MLLGCWGKCLEGTLHVVIQFVAHFNARMNNTIKCAIDWERGHLQRGWKLFKVMTLCTFILPDMVIT